jgi:hypothetical protein
MNHGRQLRLFLADGTSSGPRFYEIVNRTIQSLGIPATRIKELASSDWPEIQKPGVYLVHGTTEDAEERLYIGKGENIAARVQAHPEKLEFDVTSVLLFTSKDENLNASQVGWLESKLINAAKIAKRVIIANKQEPSIPQLSRPEKATIEEFFEDLLLISQTAGFDYFTAPKKPSHEAKEKTTQIFYLNQSQKKVSATGYPSDEGFVVKAGSDAYLVTNENSINPGYSALREKLKDQGVLIPKTGFQDLLVFEVDYAFSAPSAAAAVVIGNNVSGNQIWKTAEGKTLGEVLESQIQPTPSSPLPTVQ